MACLFIPCLETLADESAFRHGHVIDGRVPHHEQPLEDSSDVSHIADCRSRA